MASTSTLRLWRAAAAAALVALLAAACSSGGDADRADQVAGGLTCAEIESAQADAADEVEFFTAMAELTERTGATLDSPAEGAEQPADAPEDFDGDVSGAFERLADASAEFAEAHPEVRDRSGAEFEALSPEGQEAYNADLEAMLTEHEDDFSVTWAWLGQVESELGCSSPPSSPGGA